MMKILVVMAFSVLSTVGPKEKTIIEGKASYYSDFFQNLKCADGSIFKQNKLTAASNIFPLGSILKIWEVGGDDTVEIKVTDRMGKETGKRRILDLSKRAMVEVAGKEGIRKGVININIEEV